MRHSGKAFEREVGHPLLGTYSAIDVDSDILFTPHHQRRCLNPEVARINRVPMSQQGAIIAHHRRASPGTTGGGAVHLLHVAAKAVLIAAGVGDQAADGAAIASSQPQLRQDRQLEEEDVPALLELTPILQFAPSDRGMRNIHDHQSLQRPQLQDCEHPSDDCAPVMRDESHLLGAAGINQSRDILSEMVERVVANLVRPRRPAIAAQIWRPHAVSHFDQQGDLVTPAVMDLGKAMQAQREMITLARLRDFECQPVGFDPVDGDSAVTVRRPAGRSACWHCHANSVAALPPM